MSNSITINLELPESVGQSLAAVVAQLQAVNDKLAHVETMMTGTPVSPLPPVSPPPPPPPPPVVLPPPPVEPPPVIVVPPPPPTPAGERALYLSAEWVDRWQKAIAEGKPWAVIMKQAADGDLVLYQNIGQFAAWMLAITGDPKYADETWAKADAGQLFATDNINWTREYLPRQALIYLSLQRAGYWKAHPDRRDKYFATLNQWCDLTIERIGLDDSDQVVGALGIYLWALISLPDGNPRAAEFRDHPFNAKVKAQVTDFFRRAEGGQWIESSGYNHGTVRILILCLEGIRAVTGADYIPEALPWFQQAAVSEMATVSPGLNLPYQWGDNEHPRSLQLYERVAQLACIAGVTQNPYLQWFIKDLGDKYGWSGSWATIQPWDDVWVCYDPFAPTADWRALPAFAERPVAAHDNPGIGLTILREGNNAGDAFAGIHANTRSFVDHWRDMGADYQILWRDAWVATHPIGYGQPPGAYNAVLVCGFGSGFHGAGGEVCERIGYEKGPDYVYSCAAVGGNFANEGYGGAPERFCHEATQSLFYLPGGTNGPTIIIHDRLNVDAPVKDWQNWGSYWATASTAPRKQRLFHAKAQPESAGGVLSWDAGNGVTARVSLLTPGQAVTVERETKEMFYAGQDSELGWQARVTFGEDRKWDTALYVHQGYDTANQLAAPMIVRSDGGEAEGAVVKRPGYPDTAVLFNTRQGPDLPPTVYDEFVKLKFDGTTRGRIDAGRRHAGGFTVTVPEGVTYLCDLDPAKAWTCNGAPLAVSAAGVAKAGGGRLVIET